MLEGTKILCNKCLKPLTFGDHSALQHTGCCRRCAAIECVHKYESIPFVKHRKMCALCGDIVLYLEGD